MNQMTPEVFTALMQNTKYEKYSDTHYAFISKVGNNELHFGIENDIVYIECFGHNHGKGWIELDVTDQQYNEMKRKIDTVEYLKEREPLPYRDEMFDNGVRGEDFY